MAVNGNHAALFVERVGIGDGWRNRRQFDAQRTFSLTSLARSKKFFAAICDSLDPLIEARDHASTSSCRVASSDSAH